MFLSETWPLYQVDLYLVFYYQLYTTSPLWLVYVGEQR